MGQDNIVRKHYYYNLLLANFLIYINNRNNDCYTKYI